ncbi:hypothetical protein SKAU_G00138860 [Synaphobranchus kaupii]|uniref:Homeobox domain-containing protein n=1 Tax=Synaphobranchus kaupii TaxID=118154 RepID=A0A9Q1FSQ0_SYNKA|nr:hypothetical protein SKAU_G00138860 [Synaphobranchus kaupii]
MRPQVAAGRRRGRQTYSRYQTLELEKEFLFNPYLTRKRRIEVSHALGLTERQFSASQRLWLGVPVALPFSSVPGLYSSGSMHPQNQSMYPAGYDLNAGSFNMHCSPFDQNLSMMCTGDPSKQSTCGKAEKRDCDQQNESNFRIYPWMRSAGVDRKRGRQTYTRYQTLELEKEFHFNRYLTKTETHRKSLMHSASLSARSKSGSRIGA